VRAKDFAALSTPHAALRLNVVARSPGIQRVQGELALHKQGGRGDLKVPFPSAVRTRIFHFPQGSHFEFPVCGI
jgi:hypothetical protein